MPNNDEIRAIEDFTYDTFDKFVILINDILDSMSLKRILNHAITVWDYYKLSLDDPKDRKHLEEEILYELWLDFKEKLEREIKGR